MKNLLIAAFILIATPALSAPATVDPYCTDGGRYAVQFRFEKEAPYATEPWEIPQSKRGAMHYKLRMMKENAEDFMPEGCQRDTWLSYINSSLKQLEAPSLSVDDQAFVAAQQATGRVLMWDTTTPDAAKKAWQKGECVKPAISARTTSGQKYCIDPYHAENPSGSAAVITIATANCDSGWRAVWDGAKVMCASHLALPH